MSADPRAGAVVVDLDDAQGLLDADRQGLLRAASMAGAQMRATAAAHEEGLFERLRADGPPRTVIWVAARGPAEAAGAMLAAALGASIVAPIVLAAEVPPWIGALDVLVVAGDDAGDPVLVTAVATGVRRGARVLVVAPDEGPLRDAAAGRAAVLAPRLPVPDDFGLARYLAAGLIALDVVDPGMQVNVAELADQLDAEALRNSARRDLFTNPAKALADRLAAPTVVLAGHDAPMLALARHVSAVLLRVAQRPVAATGLSDLVVALRGGMSRGAAAETSLFHDEEIDGPLPSRVRSVVLTSDEDRPMVVTRLSGYDDVTTVSANDVGPAADGGDGPGFDGSGFDGPGPGAAGVAPPNGRLEQQLAMMAVRLEMAAVYVRLVRG